jgi:hypothetical protein
MLGKTRKRGQTGRRRCALRTGPVRLCRPCRPRETITSCAQRNPFMSVSPVPGGRHFRIWPSNRASVCGLSRSGTMPCGCRADGIAPIDVRFKSRMPTVRKLQQYAYPRCPRWPWSGKIRSCSRMTTGSDAQWSACTYSNSLVGGSAAPRCCGRGPVGYRRRPELLHRPIVLHRKFSAIDATISTGTAAGKYRDRTG